jgi:hypothetical protein
MAMLRPAPSTPQRVASTVWVYLSGDHQVVARGIVGLVATRSVALSRQRLTIVGDNVHYTVPAGAQAILKGVYGTNWSGAATNITVELRVAGGAPVAILYTGSVNNGAPFLWEGWAVLMPGDNIYVAIGAQPVDVWTSGALLGV